MVSPVTQNRRGNVKVALDLWRFLRAIQGGRGLPHSMALARSRRRCAKRLGAR